jgi:hypothetical protein
MFAPGARRRSVDRSAPEVQGGLVHGDPAVVGRELLDDPAHGGDVELADRLAADHVDLRLAGAIDVDDAPERAATLAHDLAPDDLVPVRLARLEVGGPIDGHLEVVVPQALGGRTSGDLPERKPPPRAVGDGGRRRDRERALLALQVERRPRDEPLLGPVGQDLDANRAAEPVEAADEADDEPGGDAGIRRRRR